MGRTLGKVEAAENGGVGDVVARSESLAERDESGCEEESEGNEAGGRETDCRST